MQKGQNPAPHPRGVAASRTPYLGRSPACHATRPVVAATPKMGADRILCEVLLNNSTKILGYFKERSTKEILKGFNNRV
jgi:hypothetical protein